MNNDLISRSTLIDTFSNTVFFDEDSKCKALEIIDNAPAVEPEKAKESELIKAYTKGFDTGVETARTEAYDELDQAIKIIKDVCRQHKNCVECPMNGNCNEYPEEWKETNE